MSEKTYRGAVIGLGIMGDVVDGLGGRNPDLLLPGNHAAAYVEHPRTELIAGATRDLERQARFGDKRGAPIYGDYRGGGTAGYRQYRHAGDSTRRDGRGGGGGRC